MHESLGLLVHEAREAEFQIGRLPVYGDLHVAQFAAVGLEPGRPQLTRRQDERLRPGIDGGRAPRNIAQVLVEGLARRVVRTEHEVVEQQPGLGERRIVLVLPVDSHLFADEQTPVCRRRAVDRGTRHALADDEVAPTVVDLEFAHEVHEGGSIPRRETAQAITDEIDSEEVADPATLRLTFDPRRQLVDRSVAIVMGVRRACGKQAVAPFRPFRPVRRDEEDRFLCR